jgi:hypothetical protein
MPIRAIFETLIAMVAVAHNFVQILPPVGRQDDGSIKFS